MGLIERLKYTIKKRLPLRLKFRQIYKTRGFGGTSESVSGVGSTLETTQKLREELEHLIINLKIQKILDAPCGDFNWMKQLGLGHIDYYGMDIVDELIRENKQRYGGIKRNFLVGDIRATKLPYTDLIICRDCLVHLSFADAERALRNFISSGARWILLTTFPELESNRDLISGLGWRPLNMQLTPFNLPKPDVYLSETESNEQAGKKSLGLWSGRQVMETYSKHKSFD